MNRRAFARTDCVALVAIGVLAGATIAPSMASARGGGRGVTDQAHLAQLMQGFTTFAASHSGNYPLPSRLDLMNATVNAPGFLPQQKDNTGNLFSFLIYSGYATPETMVSPVETATATVMVDTGYEYTNPSRAVIPALAVWDPGFAGTAADTFPRRTHNISNQSYAHALPFGRRLQTAWTTWSATLQPIITNRGPTYQGTTYPANGQWTLTNGPLGTLSNTLYFYGDHTHWEGYAAFNDGGVRYQTTPTPPNVRYRRNTNPVTSTPDNMFVNETDEVNGDGASSIMRGTNAFLRPVAQVSGFPNNITITTWND